MRYLLDTNVCVRFLNGRSAAVRDRLLAISTDDMAVCSVVKAELFYGAMRKLAGAGTPIGPCDLQVASIALANNITLITHNTREFQRVEGLSLEDWEVEK